MAAETEIVLLAAMGQLPLGHGSSANELGEKYFAMAIQREVFGFKRLTMDNWLAVDPAWAGVVMSSSLPDPSEAWVFDLVQSELEPTVPLNVRRLFEIARGTLVYSLMFYPLLTLGTEQMFRVFETALSEKCANLSAPAKIKTFANKIEWLTQSGAIDAHDQTRWTAIRHLRNEASHPKDQSIFPPSEALHIVDAAIELINPLFR
jgi:hypothetical protein